MIKTNAMGCIVNRSTMTIKIYHADLLIDQTTFSLRLGAKERLNGLFLNKTSQRKKEHLVGIVKRTGDCSELNCQDCALTFKTELNFY